MMGFEEPSQEKLFYTHINMEQRIRPNHPLRKIAQSIDFEFVYKEVESRYGARGNVSVPPPVILKLMLLLVFYNVRSERELMATLSERLDWLWFLGYNLDSPIPDHSVLSKARRRWGVAVFKSLFERVVWQCVEAGLVDGSKIFVDASLIEADAANVSVIDTQSLKGQLSRRYRELEARLSDQEKGDPDEQEPPEGGRPHREVNNRFVSTTDPQAAIVRQGKPKLYYQTNRAVDARSEVITAVEVTPGDVNEAHLLIPLLEAHREHTERSARVVVADSKYGTIDNFLACQDRGIRAHLPDLGAVANKRMQARQKFSESDFAYDPLTDTYQCPGGKRLFRKSLNLKRQSIDYAASKADCAACGLRPTCTENAAGRTIKRHLRKEDLDRMRLLARSPWARRDQRIRRHLMERSFAHSTRFGFDRARWRGRWRVQIQEYLVCTLQNIQVLLKYGRDPKRRAAVAMRLASGWNQAIQRRSRILFACLLSRFGNSLKPAFLLT
jgi:transposase